MRNFLLAIFLQISSVTVIAQTPIPRVGGDRPTGTYKSGGYCKPFNR